MGRLTCESVRSFDLRRALREGTLKVGAEFVVSLTRGSETADVIYVISEGDALVLIERGFRQRVAISWTPCRLGGKRAWAICPRCSPEGGHTIRPWRPVCLQGLRPADLFESPADPQTSRHSESAQNARKVRWRGKFDGSIPG